MHTDWDDQTKSGFYKCIVEKYFEEKILKCILPWKLHYGNPKGLPVCSTREQVSIRILL